MARVPANHFDDVPASTPLSQRGRPPGAFAQLRRFDALRSLLLQHPKGLTIYELAERLRVTPRSVRRYLKELHRELDLEVVRSKQSKDGRAHRWRIVPAEVPRRVALRRTQAYALLAARPLLAMMHGSTLFEEIELATQRLLGVARRPGRGPNAGVADARLEERFTYLPFAPKDYSQHSEALDDLFHAVADLRPLRCRYAREEDGQEERILVHPYALVLYKDAIYCIALEACEAGRIRTLALDRMAHTALAHGERFEVPPDFRVEQYAQGQFGIWAGGEPAEVVIDLDPQAAEQVRTRQVHPSQQLEMLPNGSVRLRLWLGELTEVTTWVLGFGPLAAVVSPPELRRQVRRQLQAALARYPDDGSSAFRER